MSLSICDNVILKGNQVINIISWLMDKLSLIRKLSEYRKRLIELDAENVSMQRRMFDCIEKSSAERVRYQREIAQLREKLYDRMRDPNDLVRYSFFCVWLKETAEERLAGNIRVIGKDLVDNVIYDSNFLEANIGHLLHRKVIAVDKYDNRWEIRLGE